MTNKDYQAVAKNGREERAAQYQAEMQRQIDSVDYYNCVMGLIKAHAEIWRERGNHERYCDYMRVRSILQKEYHRKAMADENPIPINNGSDKN